MAVELNGTGERKKKERKVAQTKINPGTWEMATTEAHINIRNKS